MKNHKHRRYAHYTGENVHAVQMIFYKATYILELLISLLVIIGIGIELTHLPSMYSNIAHGNKELTDFFREMFNIIIGIELVKMLCRHDLDSVVEVLLFAVGRYMIIEHLPIHGTLIGVITIAILFIIRKFLFVSALDKDKDDEDEDENEDDKEVLTNK